MDSVKKGNEAGLFVQKYYEGKGYVVHRARASACSWVKPTDSNVLTFLSPCVIGREVSGFNVC